MTGSNQFVDRFPNPADALDAERLVDALDSQADDFAALFAAADAGTFAALICYAALAGRELAERDHVPLSTIRRRLRAQVAHSIAATQPNGAGQ